MPLNTVDPEKIVNSCRQILSDAIKAQLIIQSTSNNPYELRYSLSLEGFNTFGTTDRDIPVIVVPFLQNYWLHFSLQFKGISKGTGSKRYNQFLAGVSMAVFYGLATDQNKLLMFRAEWDNKEDHETTIIHPQPHWHIHNIDSAVRAEAIPSFRTFIDSNQEEVPNFLDELNPQLGKTITSKIADLSSFHFAMSAGGILGQPTKHVLTEANLKVWLGDSIKHIREQLEYCQ